MAGPSTDDRRVKKVHYDALLALLKAGARDKPTLAPPGLGAQGQSNFKQHGWIVYVGHDMVAGKPLYQMTGAGYEAYRAERDVRKTQ